MSSVRRALCLLIFCCLLGAGGELRAATVSEAFKSAWTDFHQLTKDSKRAKYRSYWKDLEDRFDAVYKRSPGGSYAPKALYYAGRANEELGKRSFLARDHQRAVDYYARAAARFPAHDWTDDCLYRMALIKAERLKQTTSARRDLQNLISDYPQGDMAPKAATLLADLGGPTAVARQAEPDPPIAPPLKPRPIPASVPVPEPTDPSKQAGTTADLAPRRDVPPKGVNALREIRYRSSDDYTRVVLELDEEIPYRYQVLDADPANGKPPRLYIDLEDTVLGSRIDQLDIADGILTTVRAGQHDPSTSRVVLDFTGLQRYAIFALEGPYRIVIDVSAPAGGTDALVAAVSKPTASPAHQPKPGNKPKPKPEKQSFTIPAPGSEQQAGNLIEQLGLSIQTIMVDPGHGGKDPGAVGPGRLYEKNVNLRFAKILGEELQKRGFTVVYTRTKDVFIPLEERTAMANVRKADLFISVHCNAHDKASMKGFETYYLNLAKSKSAVRVAARENAVTAKRISDLQFILTDLMLNSKMKESEDLAGTVHKAALTGIRKHYQVTDHGVRTAPFYVLMGAKMPSILLELGYITNPTESKRLQSNSYLTRKAKGIADGIGRYKSQIERYASL